MWAEGDIANKMRKHVGVSESPLWLVVSATGQEVGSGREPIRGYFFVFSSICGFFSGESSPSPHWMHDAIDEVITEDSSIIRIASAGRVFKLSDVADFGALSRTIDYLRKAHETQVDEMVDADRAAIVHPEHTRRIHALGKVADGEYVVDCIDGAIITTQRLFFATSLVRLSSILMMRKGESTLTVIVNKTLTMKLRCSSYQQSVIVRLWLASLQLHDGTSAHDDPTMWMPVLERLHVQFCAIDTSDDGVIAEDELTDALGPLFAYRGFTRSFFRALDRDGDQSITFSEFASGMAKLLAPDCIKRIQFSFELFDEDGDGMLSEEELMCALRTLASTGDVNVGEAEVQEVCESLFTIMDEDDSGSISMEEYVNALNDNIQVHELFRRIGISTENRFRDHPVDFGDRLITFGDPLWSLSASVMQALLMGINLFRARVPKGESVTTTPSQADFDEIQTCELNLSSETVKQFGSPSSRTSREGTLTVFAPVVFHTLRQSYGMNFNDFRDALGLNNVVGNMMLGSMSALQRGRSRGATQSFVSASGEIAVETISQLQRDTMLDSLQAYVTYVRNNPQTFLPRILMLLTMACDGHEIHAIVSLNPVRTRSTLPASYMLQGIPNRFGTDGTLREGDLSEPVRLFRGWIGPVNLQLTKDVAFLTSMGCTDFSVSLSLTALQVQHPQRSQVGRSIAFNKALQGNTRDKKKKNGGFLCCGSTQDVKQSPVVDREDDLMGRREEYLDESVVFRQNMTENNLLLSPISVFHEYDGGIQAEDHSVVIVELLDPFIKAVTQNAAQEFGDRISAYLPNCLAGDDDESDKLVEVDPQSSSASVVTDSGKNAKIVIDSGKKQLFLVGNSGKSLLSMNVVLSSAGNSFVRSVSEADKYKGRLTIRSGMDLKTEGPVVFNSSKTVSFANIVERETFMSEVYKAAQSVSTQEGLKVSNIKVTVITWNVGDATPSSCEELLKSASDSELICFAVQECNYHPKGQSYTTTCGSDWFNRVHSALPYHERVCADSLWSIRVIMLVHKSCVHRVSNVSSATEATGIGSVLGNKGGVAIGLKFDETSLLFIGSHLAAHLEHTDRRNRDFEEIVEGCSSKMAPTSGIDLLNTYHHVFWCGDLNYRINSTFENVVKCSKEARFHELYPHDQLMQEMDKCAVFHGFTEPAPSFTPTYRFLRNTDPTLPRMFDEWKFRIPSWCDRILHKSLGHPVDSVKRLEYDAYHDMRSSDHSPVYAKFEVTIRQQYCFAVDGASRCCGVRISGLKCTNLMKADTFGLSDPWVRFVCPLFSQSSKETRTRTIMKTLDPVWDEDFQLEIWPAEVQYVATQYLKFVIFDEDYNGMNDPLGQAVLSLHVIASNHFGEHRVELPVMRYGTQKGTLSATVSLVELP